MFVSPAVADLHLQPTATDAIDQAATLASVINDFDGEARPQGPGYDVGADEFSSGPLPCLFCDDFNDDVLSPGWTYLKPAWSESGGSLRAAPAKKKAIGIATPFTGCITCSVESAVTLTGGTGNKVWMLGWYADKNNTMELLIKEESDRMILKQRAGGSVVRKQKAALTIAPNTPYVIRISYNGAQFTVLVNSNPVITLTPGAAVPSGTIGFQVANTTAAFDYIRVQ